MRRCPHPDVRLTGSSSTALVLLLCTLLSGTAQASQSQYPKPAPSPVFRFRKLEEASTQCGYWTEGVPRLTEGRVEICLDFEWRPVCDSSWTVEDGRVLCRQLGFQDVISISKDSPNSPVDAWYYRPECRGYEERLDKCSFASTIGTTSCDTPVTVQCSSARAGDPTPTASPLSTPTSTPNWQTCNAAAEGAIKLLGNSLPGSGDVWICHESEWRPICDNGWAFEKNNAAVVCRELGWFAAEEATGNSRFRSNDNFASYWLYRVDCNGTEDRLSDCWNASTVTWNSPSSCATRDAAGVVCAMAPPSSTPSVTPTISASSSALARHRTGGSNTATIAGSTTAVVLVLAISATYVMCRSGGKAAVELAGSKIARFNPLQKRYGEGGGVGGMGGTDGSYSTNPMADESRFASNGGASPSVSTPPGNVKLQPLPGSTLPPPNAPSNMPSVFGRMDPRYVAIESPRGMEKVGV